MGKSRDTGNLVSKINLFSNIINSRVGVGTLSPNSKLDVNGDLTTSSINNGPLAGFRNAIINGNFDIWQRGTSFTGNEYGADRWFHRRAGTTHVVTRESFVLGQTDVPGEPTYFCRTVVSSVTGVGNFSFINQRIEDVRTFAGQQVTVSFYAKVDTTKNIAVELLQIFGSGGSPSFFVSSIGTTKVSIGTEWQKVTVTATLPSISGKTLGTDNNSSLYLYIYFDAGSNFNDRTDSLGHQSGTFDIAQVQVERGPVATPFERRPIGTELALCQRYYQVYSGGHFGCNTFKYMAGARTSSFNGGGSFIQEMRAVPTLTVGWNTFNLCTQGTHIFDTRSISFRVDVTDAGNYRATGGTIVLNAEL